MKLGRIFILVVFLMFIIGSAGSAYALLSTDVNGDGKIDTLDVIALLRQYPATGNLTGDIDQNQKVNSADFGYVLWDVVNRVTLTPTPEAGCTYPAQVLNLMNWKETLPIGPSGSPTEIFQPQLATYVYDPYFKVNGACTAVQFRAPTNGVTTSGSGYPRSELREMTSNGTVNASWSTTSGTHTMYIDEAITAVPLGKKHIVAGQIHDASDDVMVIRLEYPKLFVDINGSDGAMLDANYTLGKRFNVKFVVTGGVISLYYNGSASPAETLSKSGSGYYFKAGAYTQSNCSTESDKGYTCSNDNYGEVQIYNVWVEHR